MKNNFNGFQSDFLKDHQIDEPISLPKLHAKQLIDVAPISDNDGGLAHYMNYSLMLSASRKFPFFTASNIHGKLLCKVKRNDAWKNDDRAGRYQWGSKLYSAETKKDDFDKGHMTRREDVQWGHTEEEASAAAESTFYYTNAVPQHKNLNRKIWRRLEDYVLHK